MSQATPLGPSPRVLILRLRRLGDILRVTPVLRALRLARPQARIDVMVAQGFEGAVAGNPHIDAVLIAKPGIRAWAELAWHCRRQQYDMVLDLQSSTRTLPYVVATGAACRIGWSKRWLRDRVYTQLIPGWDDPVYFASSAMRFVEAIGLTASTDLRLELAVSQVDRDWAAGLWMLGGEETRAPRIALSVAARDAGRQWPLQAFAELANRLVDEVSVQLVLAHAPGETAQIHAFAALLRGNPRTVVTGDLSQLAAVYECCDLWIGNDGGPKHVATAVACPTVTLVRRSDRPIAVDASDPCQVAVAPPQDGVDSLAAIPIDQTYAIVRTHLRRIGSGTSPSIGLIR